MRKTFQKCSGLDCGFKGPAKFFAAPGLCLVCKTKNELALIAQLLKASAHNVENCQGRMKRLRERELEATLTIRLANSATRVLHKDMETFKKQMKYERFVKPKTKKPRKLPTKRKPKR